MCCYAKEMVKERETGRDALKITFQAKDQQTQTPAEVQTVTLTQEASANRMCLRVTIAANYDADRRRQGLEFHAFHAVSKGKMKINYPLSLGGQRKCCSLVLLTCIQANGQEASRSNSSSNSSSNNSSSSIRHNACMKGMFNVVGGRSSISGIIISCRCRYQ